ncbi:MAG: hypothetical protein K2K12_03110 [Clostridia bacterium]|nr:hypothetical protein [Clostridia bacterium]
MKKMLAVLLAGVLAVGMCAGFVACGGGDTGINADTDFKEIISDKVMEKQWNNAFASHSFNNFKMRWSDFEGRVRNLYLADKILYESVTYDEKENPNIDSEMYLHSGEGVTTVYVYYHSNATLYVPVISSDKWVRYEENVDFDFKEYIDENYMSFDDVNDAYSLFEYSDEINGYVYYDSEGHGGGSVVKFKDKKCCCIYWFDDAGNIETSALLYDYGKTKLTLPTVEE